MKKQSIKKPATKSKAKATVSTKPSVAKPKTKNIGEDMHASRDGKYDSGYHAGDEVW